jgi:hypothetical protein
MPHRFVYNQAAFPTCRIISCANPGHQVTGGRPVDIEFSKTTPQWLWFKEHSGDVGAVASEQDDIVSRVNAAIGEQALRGGDQDASGERVDRGADLVRRRE